MVLHAPQPAEDHPLRLEDLPQPEPAEGQIRVRVNTCGICHTDLHTIEGDLELPTLPIVPGHQIIGRIDAVGAGVKTLHEGDRVGVPWLYSTDQVCEFCLEGRENLCERAKFTGLHANGGYAEWVVVDAGFAYSLPEVFNDLHAAPLLCAGVIGYRSYRLSGARRGDRVGLYGFGASAHIVLQLARHEGCEVYVFTRSEQHRALAHQLGAAWTGSAHDTPPAKMDASIVFAPAGELVPQSLRVLRKGGTLALAGISMSAIPEFDYGLIYHEKVLRSVANSTRRDVRELLDLAAEAPIRIKVQEFALEQANDALAALKHSQINGAGVLRVSYE